MSVDEIGSEVSRVKILKRGWCWVKLGKLSIFESIVTKSVSKNQPPTPIRKSNLRIFLLYNPEKRHRARRLKFGI